MKYVPPSVKETAFNCPHCGALAKQFWHHVYSSPNDEKKPLPVVLNNGENDKWTFNDVKEADLRERLIDWATKMMSERPFLERVKEGVYVVYRDLNNVHITECFNCNELAVWIHSRLVYPQRGESPLPNPDLPSDIRRDYDEASSILDLSPRGAAALLRLGIQKLCKELGQPGRNINADISALVASGLDSRVQKALDALRVIGNEAVHPGTIDLRDDRATAESLFRLMNLIADKMISEPKHVDEVYNLLPESKRAEIDRRDKKSDGPTT